jgi:hypothetical protein
MTRSSGEKWRFIWGRDACYVGQLAAKILLVQTTSVSADRLVNGTIDEYFDEPRLCGRPDLVTCRTVRGNRRHDRDDAVSSEQSRNESDAPDVLIAVLAREAKSSTERRANLVAVEDLDAKSPSRQLVSNCLRERRLACARESGKPQYESLLPCR